MTDNDIQTIRLPHTGLRVPDRSLTVTGYKSIGTFDGVVFTANLRVTGLNIAGQIANQGAGCETGFYSTNPEVFGDQQVEEYAARCRTEEDADVDYELLLNTLIDEHDWTRQVNDADRKGVTLLRQMGHLMAGDEVMPDEPPFSQGTATCSKPTKQAHWTRLAEELHVRQMAEATPATSWWQGWTGDRWIDVTPRPKFVNPDLYG